MVGMMWFWFAILCVVLMLAWARWAKDFEGRPPERRVAPPARLGAGFRASTDSVLTRAADTGWKVRTDSEDQLDT